MNVRVGVDVDGVLANFNEAFIDRVVRITGRDLFPERPFDIPCWNYPEFYGYTKEENDAVWNSIETDGSFWESLPAYPDTADAIEYLLSRSRWCGDDIYFVTSRPGINAKQQTEHWLLWHGYSRPTVLISGAKGLCARALKLDVYIDDRWENTVDTAKQNTRTFLMHRPWNATHIAEDFGITRTNTVVGIVEHPAPANAAP